MKVRSVYAGFQWHAEAHPELLEHVPRNEYFGRTRALPSSRSSSATVASSIATGHATFEANVVFRPRHMSPDRRSPPREEFYRPRQALRGAPNEERSIQF